MCLGRGFVPTGWFKIMFRSPAESFDAERPSPSKEDLLHYLLCMSPVPFGREEVSWVLRCGWTGIGKHRGGLHVPCWTAALFQFSPKYRASPVPPDVTFCPSQTVPRRFQLIDNTASPPNGFGPLGVVTSPSLPFPLPFPRAMLITDLPSPRQALQSTVQLPLG